jgi:hypothetical protein
MKDKLTRAYDLLVDVLLQTPFSQKDVGGDGYTVHRDGNITHVEPLVDGASRTDVEWATFAAEVAVRDVIEAIEELRDNSIAVSLTRRFDNRLRMIKRVQ